MKSVKQPNVRTLQQARSYVLKTGLCAIFPDSKGRIPSLWDAVDLPEKQPGEKGWGQKVSAVWTWKNELPATYPDEIFYGKIRGGRAVLMSMEHLKEHYKQHHVSLDKCSALAQRLFQVIRLDPMTTGALREEVNMSRRPERNQFDRALQELQVTLNVVRLNSPEVESDTWVPFSEQYLDVVQAAEA